MKSLNRVIIIVIPIIVLFFITNNTNSVISKTMSKKMSEDKPINLETGEINNDYFGINSNGDKPDETTEGINNAIEYANKNNIKNIKLKNGYYIINGIGEKNHKKGIILRSNIKLDLNNSIIRHRDNGEIRYTVINLHEIENVEICNGKIVGDRYNHDYNTIKSSHAWGYGIEIIGSKNININNIEIIDTTGDGIVLSKNKKENQDVLIKDNRISNCRRQGITIVSGTNIEVCQNEIYNINGQNPQSCIDVESDFSNQFVNNLKIHNNIFYNSARSLAIQLCWKIKNVEVINNVIYGNIMCYNCNDRLLIEKNQIKNGMINLDNKYDTEIDEAYILQNTIINGLIRIKNGKVIYVKNNILDHSEIYKGTTNIYEENNITT